MLEVLINSLILLFAIAVPLSSLFWKHFAKRPTEAARAAIATFAGIIGLVIFFLQVAVMTFKSGENLITIILTWLGY